MSNRVGIITFYYNNYNYGGLLQAYALQQAIENLGYDCNQIAYNKAESAWQKWNRRLRQNPLSYVKKIMKKVENKRYQQALSGDNPSFQQAIKERGECFNSFIKQIKHTTNTYNQKTITQCLDQFDMIITGSDQVWNWDFGGKNFFLDFVPDSVRKIAYAASMGKNSWADKECKTILPLLNRMDYISVRENQTELYLNKITDKQVYKVVDPTLLIDKEIWTLVAGERIVEEEYIFVYLLGANIKHRESIRNYANLVNKKIVTLPCIDPYNQELMKADADFGDISLYKVGPKEFISLIHFASYVFTDSFHGTVFSIIFHKRFFSFCRYEDSDKNSMNARLYSILDELHLRMRLLKDNKELSSEELEQEIEYKKVDEIIARLREESLKYLETALCS